ncbi:MAG: hypothetical protein AVDCRST_MAG25-573, partial [uncultured Rubrobacteraceae bacterium]
GRSEDRLRGPRGYERRDRLRRYPHRSQDSRGSSQGHALDEFLDDFPTVSREQAEGYLDAPPEAVRQEAQRVPDVSRRQKVFSEDEV